MTEKKNLVFFLFFDTLPTVTVIFYDSKSVWCGNCARVRNDDHNISTYRFYSPSAVSISTDFAAVRLFFWTKFAKCDMKNSLQCGFFLKNYALQ